MKRILPMMAVLAATLATPVAAQDMSSVLNPGNFAARLGMSGMPAFNNLPRGALQAPMTAAQVQSALNGQMAALAPETRSFAPHTSILPIRRGAIVRVVTPTLDGAPVIARVAPESGSGLVAMMAEAAEAAPAGANTVVINGSNTAVIQSSPTAVRPGFWQRLFGG